MKSGHTEIIATYNGVEARVPIDVLYVEKIAVEPTEVKLEEGGPSTEVKVKAFDYLGKELRDRTPTFHSGNEKIAGVAQGSVFGYAPGETTVTVQVDGVKATVPVTVEKEKGAKK